MTHPKRPIRRRQFTKNRLFCIEGCEAVESEALTIPRRAPFPMEISQRGADPLRQSAPLLLATPDGGRRQGREELSTQKRTGRRDHHRPCVGGITTEPPSITFATAPNSLRRWARHRSGHQDQKGISIAGVPPIVSPVLNGIILPRKPGGYLKKGGGPFPGVRFRCNSAVCLRPTN